jgi:hypothetical protein
VFVIRPERDARGASTVVEGLRPRG